MCTGPWDPGTLGRSAGPLCTRWSRVSCWRRPASSAAPCTSLVSVSSPLTWAKGLSPGEQECSEQPPRQGDGAHEGCPCYGVWGCGGPSLISLGLCAPQLACGAPSSNPQDPGGAGKATLFRRKGRITRRPGQGSAT